MFKILGALPNKQIYTLAAFLFFFSSLIKSQDDQLKRIDSILNRTPIFQGFDSEEKGLDLIKQSRSNNYLEGEIKALRKLSEYYRTNQNQEKALKAITEAKEKSILINDDNELMIVNSQFIQIYNQFGYYKESLDLIELNRALAEKLNDTLILAKTEWQEARVNYRLGKLDDFFSKGYKALTMFESIDDYYHMSWLHIRLGSITRDSTIKFEHFSNAECLIPLIADEIDRKANDLLLNSFLAITYLDKGDYHGAEKPTRKALNLANELDEKDTKAIKHNYLARIYFHHYQDYAKAKQFEIQHLMYEISIDRYWYAIPSAQLLMKICMKLGEYEEAMEYAQIAMNYQDTLYWANRKDDAKDIEEIKHLEQQYAEVHKLEQQRKFRTILGIGGTSFFLMLAGFFFYQRQQKNKNLDIQRKLSAQLKTEKEKTEEQNKQLSDLNATKDKLLAIIGHDLRGPLFSLQGLEEQINYLIETNQTERLKELGSKMEATSKGLSGTLNNLLNWSRLQMGKFPYHPVKLSLHDELERVISLFNSNAEAKFISFEIHNHQEYFIHADANAVRTILRNVISNALKYSNPNTIIHVYTLAKDDNIILRIKDEGIGMGQDQISAIINGEISYEKMGTHGESSSGIGMSLCRDLIIQNKGEWKIDSKKGVGTTVQLLFPSF